MKRECVLKKWTEEDRQSETAGIGESQKEKMGETRFPKW